MFVFRKVQTSNPFHAVLGAFDNALEALLKTATYFYVPDRYNGLIDARVLY